MAPALASFVTLSEAAQAGRVRRPKWAFFGLLFVLLLAGVAGALARWPLWAFSTLTRVRLSRAGIHGHTLRVDGLDVHYLEGGKGRPVVFVHGLGSRAQDWAPLLPDVVRAGFHVYAMDLPGFGETDKPRERSYAIREQARFVVSFLDALHLDTVALVGCSMGGWIAGAVALDAPQRFERVVLIDSAGFAFRPGFDTVLFTPKTPADVDALMALLTPEPRAIPSFIKADVVREMGQAGWTIERALASMELGADVLDGRFSTMKPPLLLIWGKQDRITPLALGEAMQRAAPQAVLEVFDGCGHLAFSMCVARVSPRLLDFLAGKGPPAGSTVDVSIQ